MRAKFSINTLLFALNLLLLVVQYFVFVAWSTGIRSTTHEQQMAPLDNSPEADVYVYNGGMEADRRKDQGNDERSGEREGHCNMTWNWNWDGRAEKKPRVNRFLYLVRHGQYYGNGPYEKHLSPLGQLQATKIGEKLKSYNISFNRFISSTSIRAAETADLIHSYIDYVNVEHTDELREGWPTYPEPAAPGHWNKDNPIFNNDVPRLKAAFEKYIHRADPERYSDSNEILVAHGNVISYIVLRCLQVPESRWLRIAVLQGSITLIQIHPDGYVDVRFVGDVGHLNKREWSG